VTPVTAKGFAMMTRLLVLILFFCLAAGGSRGDAVGRFSNDWTGNGIVVEAVADPKVGGVTCHLVHFDRSVIDRVTKGNWFENPSNSGISCQQTGPIVIGKIATGAKGEEVFSERMSLFFKSIAVRRIYDKTTDTLVYVAYSRQVKDASAKMSLSTVALFSVNPTWRAGKP
jgi:CreA protein